MRRLPSILLLLCFLVIGTGLAAYVHDLSHDREDAAAMAKNPNKPRPVHDETNCVTHATLRAPALAQGWTPLLISLGLLVAFLTQLAPALDSQHTPARIDCRGPPALA
jgi:hypothetical protein